MCSQNRAGSDVPDPTSSIHLSSVFPKKARIILRNSQNRPGSHLDGLVGVWLNTSGLESGLCTESSGSVSGRTQPARYQFPTFRLGSVLPETSRIKKLCKTSPDPVEFRLTVSGSGQTDPVRKQANVQDSSGPLLANASQPIRN